MWSISGSVIKIRKNKGNLYSNRRSKSAPPAKRMTFIDDIFLQNTKEKYPKPGPGKYNENRSIETLSKKW